MVDERLKKYFTIIKTYHNQQGLDRMKMWAGFIRASAHVENDPFTRHLIVKFYNKESIKYAPHNSNPEPPRFA